MVSVCYTADEAYAMQVAVSMVSMLENNKDVELEFYILSNNYSDETRNYFRVLESKYKCRIFIINVEKRLKELLVTKIAEESGIIRNGTVSFMFARLFIGNSIPGNIEKIIYIDCDTLFVGDIRDLYNIELKEEYIFAAVRDLWPCSYNEKIGLSIDDLYFQSGIMLIDLKKWRCIDCENIILNHIKNMNHYYYLHDQDILNICFKDKIQTLPVSFGMVYLLRKYSTKQILGFCEKDEEHYYSEEDIKNAKKDTYVIHYAGDYFGRPWTLPMACEDSRLWLSYFKKTPWNQDYLKKNYNPKYGFKYLIKLFLYPFIKQVWLNNLKKRIKSNINRMDSL